MKKTNVTVLILILVLVTLLCSMANSAFAHEEPQAGEGRRSISFTGHQTLNLKLMMSPSLTA